ncbi:MAG: hypothetical protein ACI8PT_001290 [Gammaproteobacteria bacterium]|jgi:hypothetical protein
MWVDRRVSRWVSIAALGARGVCVQRSLVAHAEADLASMNVAASKLPAPIALAAGVAPFETQSVLERDVARDLLKVNERVGDRVSLMLLKHYDWAPEGELLDFLDALQSPALGWLIERESTACTSMVSQGLDEALTELVLLIDEAQREAPGLGDSVTVEGLEPREAVEKLIEPYGKVPLVKVLIQQGNGQITVQVRGSMRSVYGIPLLDLVNAKTILRNFSAAKMTPFGLAKRLGRRAVADRTRAKSHDRAGAVDGISACPMELKIGYSRARSCRGIGRARFKNCRAFCPEKRQLCSSSARDCTSNRSR